MCLMNITFNFPYCSVENNLGTYKKCLLLSIPTACVLDENLAVLKLLKLKPHSNALVNITRRLIG